MSAQSVDSVLTKPLLRTGPWNLSDLIDVPKNGLKVFSTFSCGGGSTMGYKLSGYDLVGCCEIDPKMFSVYKANHNPRHGFNKPVSWLLDADLPEELFDLDVLDGSPPCSSFSMSGSREKAWGEKKKFKEGQAKQVLDNLFFEYINVAKRLKPKVVVAENVKGLIAGNARGYVKMIFEQLGKAGYEAQLFLLNSATMGVPQRRERTFFVAKRKDLGLPKLKLSFSEKPIILEQAFKGLPTDKTASLPVSTFKRWRATPPGGYPKTSKGNTFGHLYRAHYKQPCVTLTGDKRNTHPEYPRFLNKAEVVRIQTFPEDFNFLSQDPTYICGMSVPPFMMQRLSTQINNQWLSKL